MSKKIFTLGYLAGKHIAGMRRIEKEDSVTYAFYLYNGTKLPALPKYNKSEFPCALIIHGEAGLFGDEYTWLVLCQSASIFTSTGNLFAKTFGQQRGFVLEDDQWVYKDSFMDEEYLEFHVITAIWSNVNIYNKDGTELTLSASKPVPVYEDGILDEAFGACLYNGVRLPALPEWDKEAYPYAVIYQEEDKGVYCLTVTTGVVTIAASKGNVDGKTSDVPTIKMYSIDGSQWGFARETTTPDLPGFPRFRDYIWSNHDIYRTASLGGTLVIGASEPVPV